MRRFLGALSVGLLVLPTACGSSPGDDDGAASAPGGAGAPVAGSGGAGGASAAGSAQGGSAVTTSGGEAGIRATGAPIPGAGAFSIPTYGGGGPTGAGGSNPGGGSSASGGTLGTAGRSSGTAAFSFGGGMSQLPSAMHDCSKVNRYIPCVLNETCTNQETKCSGVCQNNGWVIYCAYL